MLRSARLIGLLVPALALCSCAAAGAQFADQASDSMDAVTVEAALIVAAMDGMNAATTPEEGANNSATNAAEFWTEGCFMWTIDGASITYDLTECTGVFGLKAVTGSVTITYRETASSFGFDITSTNLAIGDATVSFTVNADVSTDARNVSVTTSGGATGRRGHVISREGTYDLRWNSSSTCAGIDGSWTTTVGGLAFTTAVTNWQRCANDCPANGGSISYTGPDASVVVSYDGSSEASWTSGAGGSGTLNLNCGE